MLVTLARDDAQRLLSVIAEGPIDFEAIRTHLQHERADGGLGYRELIDARRATPAVSSAEVRGIVELIRAEADRVGLGPTAVVVSSDVAFGVLRMVETLVEDVAAIRPFRRYPDAVAWLARAP
jgi:hypothetical protein